MSINVIVNGNSVNVRRGRMVLTDLDQIKKNECDRRRRLRLEQVRQQSKEMSDRLLERTKNVAKEELKKLEDSDKLNLKQVYNEKIMQVQQKYQEDMADIGEAHISATLECDHNALIKEKSEKNKLIAIKRGRKADKQTKNIQQETTQHLHQERLRHVRDLEDLRSKLITEVHQKTIPKKHAICNSPQKETDEENKLYTSVKKKPRKLLSKKSPGKITKSYIRTVGSDHKTCLPHLKSKSTISKSLLENEPIILKQQSVADSVAVPSTSKTMTESEFVGKNSNDKTTRYNPEDYRQTSNSDSITSDSSNSISDDSSYFSDSGEHYRCIRSSKHSNYPAKNETQILEKSTRQTNIHDIPRNIVEKIHTSNEPSAIDLAQEVGQAEIIQPNLANIPRYCAQKRGEDAMLREKVRRDYKALKETLKELASEERKLKASQIDCYSKNIHIQGEWRKMLRDQHKKRLDRALRTVLNEECREQYVTCPLERQITLTPREDEKVKTHVWEESCCSNAHEKTSKTLLNKSKEGENSREEKILDMLKKVEKQKQLLLQEFGSDLPNDIFNATTKPLFENEKSVQVQTNACQNKHIPEPVSPEIRVINTHCYDKDVKKGKMEKKDNLLTKKVEIAVQTMSEKTNVAQDKSIQVELMQEESDKSVNETDTNTEHYPIEPKITVITPDIDSSESTPSTVTDVIVDTGKQKPKIISKRKKGDMKTFKQISNSIPKTLNKSYSISANKTSSPAKKFSKSMSKSRYDSIHKMNCTSVDTPSKRIKIYVDGSGFNIKVKPPQTANVSVDVSTQNSQIYATETQEQSASKSHWFQSQSKSTKIIDTSDTSTSFASLPPIRPRDVLEVINNNISILEMLDSSGNESMILLRRDISPVSTPETPSPRTMRMPSNIPRTNELNKMLSRSSPDSEINDNSTLSSIKNDQSTTIDLSDYSKHPRVSSDFCLCKNPECKLMHVKFDDIRNYALKNCPQILQKYEDLQTTCAERIISLTNLIEKVRNEQKGMELSAINGADETNSIQLSPPKIVANDLQSVRKLVENIEAIHNQLVKTLIESQHIIKNKTNVKEEVNRAKEIEEVNVTNGNISKKTFQPIEQKVEAQRTKVKPKIISEEKVNIQIDRFKMQHKPQILMATTPEHNSDPSSKFHDEEMIEQLSKEILEQSKGFGNNSIETKQMVKSAVEHKTQTSTNFRDFKIDTSSKVRKNNITIKKQTELEKSTDFVPMLADIPKLSKTVENTAPISGRNKPPVSLLSGPYRTEIEASGHELSTIIEFDTPDTVNKSQNNIKTPSPMKEIAETQVTKSAIIVQPMENVSPLFNIHNQHFETLYDPLTRKIGTPQISPCTLKETVMLFDSKDSKTIRNQKSVENKDEIQTSIIRETESNEKQEDITRDTKSKTLEYNIVSQELSYKEELQPVSSFGADLNDQYKHKDKITSTSSNSFSGLSGISQIASTPSSDVLKYASSPEEMETALKKLGLGWAIATLKKTRQASALSSSSNSDVTPVNTIKRISPVKKQFDSNCGLSDFSDVSSISIKEASKSTEQAVLLKGRTSTPKMQNSNSNSVRTNSTNTNVSKNLQDLGDDLIIPNISLTKTKSNIKKVENL